MKKLIFTFLISMSLFAFNANAQAPASVCTSPATYSFDREVTWYFDLTGNTSVTAGEDLYFWSWEPQGLPGGAALMTYEKDMLWSLTMIPTDLWGMTKTELETAGNSAFWCNLKNASDAIVTGTIPYEQKELLRLGSQCSCIGTESPSDNTFYVNFGSSPITNPDANSNYWTNVTTKGSIYELLDITNNHRYDITTSGSFVPNNNSAFTTPDAALLGDLAIKEATESYMYLASGTGNVTISCLNPDRKYKLSIFGSRNTTSVRETKYTVTGASTQNGIIQTSGTGIATDPSLNCNDDEFLVIETFPDATGVIDILVEIYSGGYGYINMMKVEELTTASVVEVTGIAINTDNLSTSGPSQLTIDYTPANTTQEGVNWSVDDETIAIIDEFGNLKPKKAGTVTVTATSGFNSNITDNVQVTFADLITEFYLTGLATEAGSDEAAAGIKMRRVYDADSTVTNLFEIYTSMENTGTFRFFTATDGSGTEFGGDGSGNLLQAENNAITSSEGGWKYITVDLNTMTYSINAMYGWNVVSHMLPKEAGQESWWGGVESLPTYEGMGVWSGIVNFSEPTSADDSPRFYIELAGTGRAVKQVKNSGNSLIFVDKANGIDYIDLYHFNGEYKVTVDMHNFTYDITKECSAIAENKISVMGSSVAKGYGAAIATDDNTQYEGYAHQYDKLLQERFNNSLGGEWDFSNISIGGNTTVDLLNRFDRHLLTNCGSYVIYGLSLANEGIMSKGQEAFDQFKTNMQTLIADAKANNITPVVMGNYPNGYYDATDYNYIKQMNLLIHEWDVASVNLLGSLDDGAGQWVTGFTTDAGHPNTSGYTEMHYTMVPSLFDALAEGKTQPELASETYLSMGSATNEGVLSIEPENTVHSFTTSFDVNTTATGTITEFRTSSNVIDLGIDANGNLKYTSPTGNITGTTLVNDGDWHKITLSHYYAKGTTYVYVDGNLEGNLDEQVLVTKLNLSSLDNAPSAIDYRDWFFYRSAMNADEITALNSGKMLKSSLEIYAPLDGQAVLGSDVLVNLAQSKNTLSQTSTTTGMNKINSRFRIYPKAVKDILTVGFYSAQAKTVSIYNANGQIVFNETTNSNELKINTSALAKGIYLVKVENITQKFVKQ